LPPFPVQPVGLPVRKGICVFKDIPRYRNVVAPAEKSDPPVVSETAAAEIDCEAATALPSWTSSFIVFVNTILFSSPV